MRIMFCLITLAYLHEQRDDEPAGERAVQQRRLGRGAARQAGERHQQRRAQRLGQRRAPQRRLLRAARAPALRALRALRAAAPQL